jgi:hypothetical protein
VPGSFSRGADWAWFSNNYDWRAFLVTLVASLVGDVAWCAAAWVFREKLGIRGPGISGVLMRVPGMGLLTASPGWSRETQPRGWDEVPAGGHGAAGEAAVGGAAGKDVA